MLNMRDPKVKKIISTVIVVILVLAMIVPMALSALMYQRRRGKSGWKNLGRCPAYSRRKSERSGGYIRCLNR